MTDETVVERVQRLSRELRIAVEQEYLRYQADADESSCTEYLKRALEAAEELQSLAEDLEEASVGEIAGAGSGTEGSPKASSRWRMWILKVVIKASLYMVLHEKWEAIRYLLKKVVDWFDRDDDGPPDDPVLSEKMIV
jgi:hypothetical protein